MVLLWTILACTELPLTEGEPNGVQVDGLVETAHPCIGHRTDTVLQLEDGSIWIGCGTTTSGYGLHGSSDAGATWGLVQTNPAGLLDDWRINDLYARDGRVVASAAQGVVAIDPDTGAVETRFEPGNQTWNNFQVGTYRQVDGLEVAESLTGTGVVYRTASAEPWQDGYGWWTDPFGMQILDLESHDGGLYGVGSTISQPPMLFVPGADAGFGFREIVLSDAFIGEMWDVHVDDQGVLASGVDQAADEGVVFFTGLDGAVQTELRVNAQLGADEPTWVHGACRSGSDIVVLGEYSQRGAGFVLWSSDGGASFSEPYAERDWPAMHQCSVSSDAWVFVGAEGFVAIQPR